MSKTKVADESSSGGGEDPSSWNMGQDDSVVHGKHLPPSPRRQPNKSSLKMWKATAPAAAPVSAGPAAQGSKPPQLQLQQPNSGPKPGDRHSCSPSMFHGATPTASSPTCSSRSRTTSESQASLEPPQAPNPTASTSILRRKVLSKETVKQYQEKALQRQGSRGQQEDPGRARTCQSAVQIPWEKEVSKDGPGLPEEVNSTSRLGSVVNSSLQQVHLNTSEAPNHRPE